MQIKDESKENLDKIGVDKITNIINNKCYIGITEKSIYKRFYTHYSKLKTNNHKSYQYLQNSVNKYGIDNFVFEIIEICENIECIKRETYWIEYYNSTDREKGYNINKFPERSPFNIREVVEKAAITRKTNYKNDKIKLYKLKSGSFLIRENVSNVFESRSERDCKIEFILLCQSRNIKKENTLDNIFSEMFGFGNVGGFK